MSSQGCQLYVLKVSYGSIQPFLSSSNLSRYLLNDLRMYIQHIQGLCQSRVSTADHALSLVAPATTGLVSWTVVCLPAAKFKPLIFRVSGFALSNVANICIFMILFDFCLLPASFCYLIIYIWKFESHMQVANRCAPWKIYNFVRERASHCDWR
jgi:hypothetical protein